MKKNKKIIILLGCLSLSIMLINIISSKVHKIQEEIETSSSIVLSNQKREWGIKRESNHKQPDLGKKNKELIEKNNGMAIGNDNNKYIYLTFDLGYEAGYTESILTTLNKNNVPAVFFITAHYLNTSSNLVKQMLDEGHIIGNHAPRYLMSGIWA